jgi:methylglyoxal synthase
VTQTIVTMAAKKNIALIAHDSKKEDLLQWADFNRALLVAHNLSLGGLPANCSPRASGWTSQLLRVDQCSLF